MSKNKTYHSKTTELLLGRMKASGKTQMEISGATGVSQTTVGRILRGGVYPGLDTYDKIIAYLDSLQKPKRAKKEVAQGAANE